MTTGMSIQKTPTQKEAEKRRQLIDEMYGYSMGEEAPEEDKNELMELFKAYMEHRKNKQKKPLGNMFS